MVENRPPTPLDVPILRCAACGAALADGAATCGYCGAAVVRDPSRLGLVCPECFARTVEGGRFCVGCGVEIRPCPVGDAEADLPCPACEVPLRPVTLGHVVVHECGDCGGTWVRNADFDALVERVQATAGARATRGLGAARARHAVDASGPVVYRRCPTCHQVMNRRNFGHSSGVVVDWCREHGTWFDATELEAVAAFVRAGGLDDRPTELPDEVKRAMRAMDRSRPDASPVLADGGSFAGMLLSLLK
jgi:Zn-finger nucleic acid-binding protein